MTAKVNLRTSEDILSEILATDNRIRCAGILSGNLTQAKFKAREDARSVDFVKGKEDAFERLIRMDVPIILGSLSQLGGKYGKLICTGVRFDSLTLMFFKMGGSYVIVATDPAPPYSIMQKLEEKFQRPFLLAHC